MLYLQFLLFLLLTTSQGQSQQCGNTSTYCTSAELCCDSNYSPTHYGCRLGSDDVCCKPGPPLEPSSILPNCLVIGDSVSIGYTSIAVQLLDKTCQLQHGPWDVRDGGALDTKYGLACLNNFLVTQQQTHIQWDTIMFNFGLHNLNNTRSAKESYRTELQQIMQHLMLEMPRAKLIYATTTPYMKDALQNNSIVEELNQIALEVTKGHDIDILDLHHVVTSHCGDFYVNCDYCDEAPCDFHYSTKGYTALATHVADAFRSRVANWSGQIE